MDAKDALKYLNFIIATGRVYYPDSDVFKAHELAAEALEKQVPKKLKNGLCVCGNRPYSGRNLSINSHYYGECYCAKCGQKIDWSSDKEGVKP